MKKLFVLFVMSLFVVSASFAQINKNWDGTKPEVHQGAKGFVFSYTPFQSDLGGAPAGSFSGYNIATDQITVTNMAGVGFRYFVTQNISLTGGLNFGSASQTGTDTSGFDYSASTFGISVDGDYHFKSLYSVSPYFGVNINYGMISNKITSKTAAAVETKVSGGVFGAGLNFGFDWYFTPGIALGGKYTLGFNSISGKETTTGSTTVTNPKGSFFGTGTGSFQLKVNF
ncbi:MAG: outer membrane beta-barrel protein [Ignavibacteria bacterium]